MSEVKVNKISPRSGTDVTLGDSSDTFTVPTGAGLTVVDEVKTNKISPASGVAFALGDSGDTFTVPSGATITNSGTATGFGAIAWQSVVTASTLTAVAGRGYWINTTSNTCTITLPSSASNGDQIIFTDYARIWGTNKIIIDSNGLNYQGQDDSYTVEYETDGETLNIVYADATQGWIPLDDDDVTDAPAQPPTQKALFGYGYTGSDVSMTNLVSSSGVVATDTTGVGTARSSLAAAGYGADKAIFAYGATSSNVSMSNLVSNSGVVATDTTGVGTARKELAATTYGGDKAIFGYGYGPSGRVSMTNLVTNAGVVGTDVTGVGTTRVYPAAASYGGIAAGTALFGYGSSTDGVGVLISVTNLVTNVGVVGTDVSGVGTARYVLAAAGYGTDKAIFGYGGTGGSDYSMTNLVSNTGVVATDVTGVGTARSWLAAATYGGDKAIFGYGQTASGTYYSMSNLVSNTGVVATDTTGVGTVRSKLAAAGYSTSA